MATSAPEVFDGVSCFEVGDVVMILWSSPARVERTRWIGEQVLAAAGRHAGGLILLQLILPTSSPPDAEARADTARSLKEIGPSMRRMVTVPLGDAVWTNVVRAIMRATFLLLGKKNHFVARDQKEGLAFVQEGRSAETPTTAELEGHVDALYEALGLRRAAR